MVKNLLLLLTDTKTGKNTYQGISREDAAMYAYISLASVADLADTHYQQREHGC